MDIPATDDLLPYRYLQFYNLLIKRHLCKSIERVIVLPTTTKAIFIMYYSRIFRFLFSFLSDTLHAVKVCNKTLFQKDLHDLFPYQIKTYNGYNINK